MYIDIRFKPGTTVYTMRASGDALHIRRDVVRSVCVYLHPDNEPMIHYAFADVTLPADDLAADRYELLDRIVAVLETGEPKDLTDGTPAEAAAEDRSEGAL